MSDINELIKSGAVPFATPRTSKVLIPEVVISEPGTSSAVEEMEPKKEDQLVSAVEDRPEEVQSKVASEDAIEAHHGINLIQTSCLRITLFLLLRSNLNRKYNLH
jgi:hypothetical protein